MRTATSGWNRSATKRFLTLLVFAVLLVHGPIGALAQSDKIPGMSLGDFKVSNTGGANYTIPIIVPPGINGMTPKLSLVYNSQNQTSLLGTGWSLTGIPAIYRCPRTVAQDSVKSGINLDANDRFCVDGMRLMVVNGAYGAAGAEYRTELDMFVKVFSNGQIASPGSGPQSFTLKNKAGETWEFGNTTDSRIEAQGKTTVRIWALNKITDTSGNFMTISYTEDSTNGDYRPLRIDYTGNTGQGVTTQRYVQFLYEDRTDKPPLYVGGSLVKVMKRLSKIQTYAPPPQGGAVLVRDYRLAYQTGTSTGRSRLLSMTECDTNGACLPPHNFAWQESQDGFMIPPPSGTNPSPFTSFIGDFDGDGKADVVMRQDSGHVRVYLSTGSGFNLQTWAANLYSTGVNGQAFNYVGDFNADGKADILSRKDNSNCYLNLSTGSSFTTTVVPCQLNTTDARFNRVGDFNGDGKADIASFAGANMFPKVHLSTGANFNIQQWGGCTAGDDPRIIFVGDFNGDGLSDIVMGWSKCTAFSTGTNFVAQLTNGLAAGNGLDPNGLNYVGDVNGDGKADIIANDVNAAGTAVFLSNGTTFTRQLWGALLNSSGYNYVGDFNGDGKADIVVRKGPATPNACFLYLSTGSAFALHNDPCALNDNLYTYVGDFNGDGKQDLLKQLNALESGVYLSNVTLPDLLTSITNNLGGKIDIVYKPITDPTVYTKDNDAVYPVMDMGAHIFRNPTYLVDNYITRTKADGSGLNFTYTYDYGGAKFHMLGRGGLGFRFMRVQDETAIVDPLNPSARRQTTNYFNQTFPKTGLLSFSETIDTLNPTAPYSQLSNTYTPSNTFPTVVFPALTAVDKSECDKQPACFQTRDEFTFDTSGNLTLTHHVGNVADLDDQRDEMTDFIVDTVNWIHRPKRTALLDSTGTTIREKFLYYDDLNDPSQFGQLGTPPRGLLTREESRAADGTAGNQGQSGNALVTYTNDGFGNRTSTKNPIDCTTITTYETVTHTFPATVTDCLNHPATVFTWDPRFGVKLTATDPNDSPTNPVVTANTYDTFGRLTKVTGPLDTTSASGSVSFNYNTFGNPTTQNIQTLRTKDHGTATVISRKDYFDGLGRFFKNESVAAGGATIVEKFTFDSRGLMTEKFVPRFTTETELTPTKFVYDVLGREVQVTRPDGRIAQTLYFPRQATTIDENNHSKIKFFDAYGQVVEIDEKNGLETYVTSYGYDAAGGLVHVLNHLGHNTSIKYDPLGRKIALCDPNMGAGPNVATCDTSTLGAWVYNYDKAGNLLTQTDAKNQTLTFDYDLLSRVKHKFYPSGGGTIAYTYDQGLNGIGRLSGVDDLNGAITAFTYDKMGRTIQTDRTIEGTHTLTQAYNAISKVLTETVSDNSQPGETIDFNYDEGGLLQSVPGFVNSILYNARGQKDQIDYFNNVTTTFDYFDQAVPGQIINFRLMNRSTGLDPNVPTLQNLGYTYDFVGNMTSITDPLFTATRNGLTYDDLNRLTHASGPFGEDQAPKDCTHDYDAIGNIQHKCGVAYSYTDLNHPSFVTSTSDGKTYAPDPNGNTLTGAGRTFTWTADNRAATISKLLDTTVMDYDYAGARLKKFGPLGLTVYPFPGYEIDADGVKIKYIQLGNELLAAKKSSGEKMFYHNDHLGGVNVITDITGLRTELMEYDPWGKLSREESVGNAVDPTHGFTGQERDKETELYFYGGRYYDPQLARFVQPDPFVTKPNDPQEFNRYSYVLNNPYRYIDPTGYQADSGGDTGSGDPGGGSGSTEGNGDNMSDRSEACSCPPQDDLVDPQFGSVSPFGTFYPSPQYYEALRDSRASVNSPIQVACDVCNWAWGLVFGKKQEPFEVPTFTYITGLSTVSNPQPSPIGVRGNYSIVEGIAGVFVGLSSVSTALGIGLSLAKGLEEFVYHSPSWAQVGPITGLLGTLHTMQGLGMAFTIDVALSFGGGYVVGMGINEFLGLGRGGIQSQIEDLQFLLGRERK